MKSDQKCIKTHLSILAIFCLSGGISIMAIADVINIFAGADKMEILDVTAYFSGVASFSDFPKWSSSIFSDINSSIYRVM